MEPRGCNRRQSGQIDRVRKPRRQAKSVATGYHRLPEKFHGKEGVDGSSPSEGFVKFLRERGVIFLAPTKGRVLRTRRPAGLVWIYQPRR
jgi:hypothetical protein